MDTAQPEPAKQPIKWAKNQTELAQAVGRERKTIQRWRAETGFPNPRSDGRFSIPEVQAWMAQHGKASEPDEAAKPTLTDLNEIGQSIDNETKAFKLAVLKGKFIPKDSAKRVFTQFLTSAKARSLSGITRLVTLIRMAQDTASANEIARQEIMDIWREMERSEWIQKPKDQA